MTIFTPGLSVDRRTGRGCLLIRVVWVLTVAWVVMRVMAVVVVIVMAGAMRGNGGNHGFGGVAMDDDGGRDGTSGARLQGRDQRTITFPEKDLL